MAARSAEPGTSADRPALGTPPRGPSEGTFPQAPPATPAPIETQTAKGPRVYAKTRNVWVRSGPASNNQWIGMLWLGGSAPIASEKRVPGAGCGGDWVPIEPRGWVCVDGERVTLDANDKALVALRPYAPQVDQPSPHRYAWVDHDIRRFESLAHAEPFLQAWGSTKGGSTGHAAPTIPTILPKGLSERRDRMVARSALAFSGEGDHLGTGLLVAADLSWVARSDVQILPEVTFQGVELSGSRNLPLGFFRDDQTPVYRRAGPEEFVETGHSYPRLSHVFLEPESITVDKASYYKLRDRDEWLRRGQAVIALQREPFPQELRRGQAAAPDATWLEISVLGGYLIAYRGETPVYATLISAGRGGLPVRGRDLVSTASTPVGRFYVTGKFKTATMESSSGPIVHSDVPWTQNFSGPHAIHGAYWHDDWGKLKSAGCVNVSPRDGRWLFEFSEPRVPPGWHGVRHHPRYGPATLVILHE